MHLHTHRSPLCENKSSLMTNSRLTFGFFCFHRHICLNSIISWKSCCFCIEPSAWIHQICSIYALILIRNFLCQFWNEAKLNLFYERTTEAFRISQKMAHLQSNLLLIFVQLIFQFSSINTNDGARIEGGVNAWAELPAVAMDYKVHIDAGTSQTRFFYSYMFTSWCFPINFVNN